MAPSEQKHYELRIHSIPNDASPHVTKIIESRFGFRPVFPPSGHFTVSSSNHRPRLEMEAQVLRSAGAEVEVVSCEPEQIAFTTFFENYVSGVKRAIDAIDARQVAAIAKCLIEARNAGRKIILFGNGGSSAIAQHFAADLTKQRFLDESLIFRAVALVDNCAVLTATANDFGYEHVFSQQLKALIEPGDVAFGISSSGRSENILKGLSTAKARGARTIAMVGFDGGEAHDCADIVLHVETAQGKYGFVEDAHSVACHLVAIYLFERDNRRAPV